MEYDNFIQVAFRGKYYRVVVDPSSTTLGQLSAVLANLIPGLAPHTMKLLISKPKPITLQLEKRAETLLSVAGVVSGCSGHLLGSYTHELQQLAAHAAAEASLRLPGFDYEAQRAAQRRRGPGTAAELAAAAAASCFRSFRELPLPATAPASAPPPSAALSLLHRIAADPAITAVMTSHGWTVGLLSEMPPEGKVGISSVCILGYNVNRGQEVSLRLRTDDYRGFRKYLKIRETLVHELAHMVYDDHDNSFKALNSQLLKEVSLHEAAAAAGVRTLVGSVFDDNWLGNSDEQTAAAAVQQRGRVLAAGATSSSSLQGVLDARESAAAAALARWQISKQQQQHQQQQGGVIQRQPQHGVSVEPIVAHPSSPAAEVPARSSTVMAAVTTVAHCDSPAAGQRPHDANDAAVGGAGAASTTVSGDVGAGASSLPVWYASSLVDDDGVADDPATAAAEAEMTRLGSFQPDDEGEWAQQQQYMDTQQQRQQQQQQQQEGTEAAPPQQKQQQAEQTMQEAVGKEPSIAATDKLQQHPHSKTVLETVDSTRPDAAAAAAAGRANEAVDYSVATDDIVMQKLQQIQSLLSHLQQETGPNYAAALKGVSGVLSSIAEHPYEHKYRRLRRGNVAFHQKMGQYPAALKLLMLAGFSERQLLWQQAGALQHGSGSSSSSSTSPEPVLVYARDDPGLLWLVLSLVKDADRNIC